jgi:hypothetical protein
MAALFSDVIESPRNKDIDINNEEESHGANFTSNVISGTGFKEWRQQTASPYIGKLKSKQPSQVDD